MENHNLTLPELVHLLCRHVTSRATTSSSHVRGGHSENDDGLDVLHQDVIHVVPRLRVPEVLAGRGLIVSFQGSQRTCGSSREVVVCTRARNCVLHIVTNNSKVCVLSKESSVVAVLVCCTASWLTRTEKQSDAKIHG